MASPVHDSGLAGRRTFLEQSLGRVGRWPPLRYHARVLRAAKIHQFGCVRDAAIELSPLHALIGPNDSGKSTILKALRWACWPCAAEHESTESRKAREAFDPNPHMTANSSVELTFDDGSTGTTARNPNGSVLQPGGRYLPMPALLRLDPDALREPATEIPTPRPLRYVDERGRGMSAIYDALQSRDLDALTGIRRQVSALFPAVRQIGFPAADGRPGHRTLTATLEDGSVIPAAGLSEGLLYFLALSVLPHVDAGGLVLVEEPENGLHPARISEVMTVLRQVSTTTQVVIATHSPLVINELQPNEVTVVTRGASGTSCVRMDRTHNFEERARTFALGELWLSYANGVDEASLLTGSPVL